jgi:tetratricopeptide (TPR) repeat protein
MPLLAAAGFAAALLIGSCASSELSPEEKELRAKRRKMIEDTERRAQKLRELQEETSRQLLEMRLARLQRGWMRQAAAALQAGDYGKCLELAERIFNPPPRKVKTRRPVFERDDNGELTDVQKKNEKGEPVFEWVEEETPYPVVELASSMEADLRSMVGTAKFRLARREDDAEKSRALVRESIAAYRQAQRVDPDNRAARRNLGKMLFQQASRDPERASYWYAQALKEWQKELSAGYRDAEIMVLVGQALYEIGHKEASARAFEFALPEMPDNLDLMRFISAVYADVGRLDEALRLYDELLRRRPFRVEFATQKANILVRMGRAEEALQTLEGLVQCGRMRRQHWLLLGDLYSQEGLPGSAADSLSKAYGGEEGITEKNPRDAVLVADLLIRADRPASEAAGRPDSDLDRAERLLKAVKRDETLGPGQVDKVFADAAFTLGRLYRLRADRASREHRRAAALKAVRAFKSSLGELDTQGYAWLALADLAFSLGQKDFQVVSETWIDEARRYYARAAGLPETRADGHLGLGDVHYARGETAKARESYRRALEARPGDSAILAALRSVGEQAN